MNTLQINHALRSRQDLPTDVFKGTFAYNQVPISKLQNAPFAFIMNTAPSTEEGDHWIGVYCTFSHQLEVLDSAGMISNNLLKHLEFLVSKNLQAIVSNKNQLQGPCSTVCGEYCVMFIYCRLQNISFNDFLEKFSKKNLQKNDKLVHQFVHSNFDILDFERPYPIVLPPTLCVQYSKMVEKKNQNEKKKKIVVT